MALGRALLRLGRATKQAPGRALDALKGGSDSGILGHTMRGVRWGLNGASRVAAYPINVVSRFVEKRPLVATTLAGAGVVAGTHRVFQRDPDGMDVQLEGTQNDVNDFGVVNDQTMMQEMSGPYTNPQVIDPTGSMAMNPMMAQGQVPAQMDDVPTRTMAGDTIDYRGRVANEPMLNQGVAMN